MEFNVVEKFVSVNGEGKRAGELAIFIRFAGCNLDCSYCDTIWANKEDAKYITMTSQEIYEYILSTKVNNVTITGGEPLLQEGLYELLDLLSKDSEINIEIETNGSVDIEKYTKLSGKLPAFTLDYKSGTSNMEDRMLLENYRYLKHEDCVKFVVGSMEDLEKANNIINNFDLISKCNVHISSVFGKINLAQIVDFMKDNNLNGVKLQPQLHKIIWDPNARGV